jgi:hypothetical protein
MFAQSPVGGAPTRLALVVAMIALGTGCTARVDTASAATVDDEVEVDAAPLQVESYPQTEYRGHTVYLVNGRWYYPRGHRWYYYRTEPEPLVRHRRYIQAAPPARPAYAPPGEARRVQ